MSLDLIVASAREALIEAGAAHVGVYVARHQGKVQVLLDTPVAAEIADKLQTALKEAHPDIVFDFVLP